MNALFVLVLLTLSIGSIIYHHIGYPLILRWYAKRCPPRQSPPASRRYRPCKSDQDLPSVTILLPAYNEAPWISEKIRNLASIDYPRDKLKVLIYCDGCSDETAQIARATIQEAICADTFYEVIENKLNRGKVAVLNQCIAQITTDICALTDVSALISVDALLLAAEHFNTPSVGVVNPSYRLLHHHYTGESQYWQYQQNMKQAETSLGSVIGCHGAFYLFRTHLFEPLAADTINDDFILPMQIVQQHYQAVYEPAMLAVELESTDQPDDFRRRLRISAGNMQQALRLWRLFNPRNLGIAFTFFSGKGLRLLMPYFLLLVLLLPLLRLEQPGYQAFLTAQCLFYLLALTGYLLPGTRNNKWIGAITYFVAGHTANLIGGWQYLLGLSPKNQTQTFNSKETNQ
jgi:cellulose synthase/poly-beta-1,6-N-acetylglucosamine synthase-like glycosyltransferase